MLFWGALPEWSNIITEGPENLDEGMGGRLSDKKMGAPRIQSTERE